MSRQQCILCPICGNKITVLFRTSGGLSSFSAISSSVRCICSVSDLRSLPLQIPFVSASCCFSSGSTVSCKYRIFFALFSLRACLKNHSCQLHSDAYASHSALCVIFAPNSGYIARYAPFIWHKSPTNCDAHLSESNFQTRSSLCRSHSNTSAPGCAKPPQLFPGICRLQNRVPVPHIKYSPTPGH